MSGKKGGTFIELLIALLIISFAVIIVFVGMGKVSQGLRLAMSYFSPEQPGDLEVYTKETILNVSEILFKQGYGSQLPPIQDLAATGTSLSFGNIKTYSIEGETIIEAIPVNYEYKDALGSSHTGTVYIIRGNY